MSQEDVGSEKPNHMQYKPPPCSTQAFRFKVTFKLLQQVAFNPFKQFRRAKPSQKRYPKMRIQFRLNSPKAALYFVLC